MKARLILDLTIAGVPRPAGSKTSFPFVRMLERLPKPYECANRQAFGRYLREAVKLSVSTTESGKHTKAWRIEVKRAAIMVATAAGLPKRPVKGGAYSFDAAFWFPRPKNHWRANGALKPWANGLKHGGKPDATKLVRALEDALTGVVWYDDSEVFSHTETKLWSPDDGSATIKVWKWEDSDANCD